MQTERGLVRRLACDGTIRRPHAVSVNDPTGAEAEAALAEAALAEAALAETGAMVQRMNERMIGIAANNGQQPLRQGRSGLTLIPTPL